MGDWKRVSTLCQNFEPGIAPSRENAYIIRELDVTENVPHKNIETIMMTYITVTIKKDSRRKSFCSSP